MPDAAPPSPEALLTAAEVALARGEVPDLAGLALDPPRLDPDEPRRSSAELALLAQALGNRVIATPRKPELLEERRAGYQSAVLGDVPVAWPALASALAEGDREAIAAATEDLWSVDAAIWADGKRAPAELALAWLKSPGRRLLQDLALLHTLATPGQASDGVPDSRWTRLKAAAGVDLLDPPAALLPWRPWPGEPVPARWRPADAVHALYLLEQGAPAHARGAALGWLLQQAATARVVTIAGVRRQLADELPGRIAVAFSKDGPASRFAARAAEVESLCLAHAARISRAQGAEQDVAGTWAVARWIQRTTLASPFYGGDLESLATRLRALLPATATAPPGPSPALAVSHFGGRESAALDLTEHAWASAAAAIYTGPDAGLRPVPQPLIDGLRAIAGRRLSPSERAIEGGLGPDEPHVAPPMLARHVLSEGVRATWLGALSAPAARQMVEVLQELPQRCLWLATAVLDDGDALPPDISDALLERWRLPAALSGWGGAERAALGLGLRARWAEGDALRLFDDLKSFEIELLDIKISMLKQFLNRAPSLPDELRLRAVALLLDDAERLDVQSAVRVQALGVALPELGRAADADLKARALRLAEQRPFRDSVPLRRELRRLGLGGA